MSNPDYQYKTSDLSLDAAISLECKLSGIERIDGSFRVLFIFSDCDTTKKIAEEFIQDNLLVSPSKYFSELKRLKSIIHDNDHSKVIDKYN